MEHPTVAELAAQLAAVQAQLAGNHGLRRSTLKAKPPAPFDGRDRQDPTAWCYSMELYFDACHVTDDEERIAFARTRLDKDALIWLRANDDNGAMADLFTWAEFKTALHRQFQSINPHISARDTLANMRQRPNESVRSYASALRSVFLRLPGITDDEKIDRFLRGLRDSHVREECRIRDIIHEFETLVAVADRIESARRHAQTVRARFNSNSNFNGNSNVNNFQPHRPVHTGYNGAQPMELGLVGRPGRLSPVDRHRLMEEGRCFYCKEKGHLANQCLKKVSRQGNGFSRQ